MHYLKLPALMLNNDILPQQQATPILWIVVTHLKFYLEGRYQKIHASQPMK
jgi:hypothetical protein